MRIDQVVLWHSVAALCLIAGYLATQCIKLLTPYPFAMGLIPMFDLDGEANLPTFFQAQALIAAGLAFLIAACHEHSVFSSQAARWFALAFACIYLGTDEAAMIHDRIGTAFQHAMRWAPDHADWLLPMSIIGGIFGVWMLPLTFAMPRRTLVSLTIAGAVYLAGAIGLELAGKAAALAYGYDSFAYVASVAGEEGLEMFGAVLLLRAGLQHLRREGYALKVALA